MTWFLAANLPGVSGPRDLELACRLVEAVHVQNTRAGSNRTYHLVVSLHPEDRSVNGNELQRVVENLVETLGFSGRQYIAARHNDKNHEHVHVAINKIHLETFRIHSPAWDASPATPRTSTPVRFDFYSGQSGSEAVPTKK